MKRWICVLLVLPYSTYGQNWSNQFAIPPHVSAYQKNQSPITGLVDLPALLGFEKKKEVGILIENKYSLSSLSLLYVSTSHSLGKGNISLNTGIQAGALYTHLTGNLNYGIQLNKVSTMGISIGIAHFKIKHDVPELIVQTNTGIAQLINDKTLIAIHYRHSRKIRPATLKKTRIPDKIYLGIGHQVSRSVFIQMELQKQENIQLLPSLTWKPDPKIEIWCSLGGSEQLAIGIYGHTKAISTGIALANHPHLGYSIQLTLNKRFHDKE